MKIFSAVQIQKWDAFTIANKPMLSIDLMERSAAACNKWLLENCGAAKHYKIFCGKGNNGGDGLAIARMLIKNGCTVTVYILELGKIGSDDFQTNLEKLHQLSTDIHFIQSPEFFPAINESNLIIDALFGTGLNKPLHGINAALVEYINNAKAAVVSIDMPSGMYADKSSKKNIVTKARDTFTFQQNKLAFLLPENERFFGQVHILNIGLHPAFTKTEPATFEMIDAGLIKDIYKPRNAFAHKGNFGHAALLCGSHGMMGAAVLASRACLRSGVGKLTTFIPKCGYSILQTAAPEAMCIVAGEDFLLSAPGMEKYDSIGIGPGIGQLPSHKDLLMEIFSKANKPMVIDADALNMLAGYPALLESLPTHSILTPHPKEFERLFGKTENDFDRLQLAIQKSKELNIYIVLKGHHSFISTPGDVSYFNSTGNAGMATGGSGDVLTGILTGLLAQGYSPLHACLHGVYLHGLAGDLAAEKKSKEAMIAGDIIDYLGDAFLQLK